MLQVDNRSAFKCTLGVSPNEDGVENAYGVIKATFALDPAAGEARRRAGRDRPGRRTLGRSPGLEHPGRLGDDAGEAGHRRPPARPRPCPGRRGEAGRRDVAGRPDREDGPGLRGPRLEPGLFRCKASEPEPFGACRCCTSGPSGAPTRSRSTSRRSITSRGTRSAAAWSPGTVTWKSTASPCPNLEDPARLIRGPKDRPPPASFGPLAGHWEPRKSYAGTYDEAWTKSRAPYLPLDFNPRFFQAAPPDQVAEGYLKGGEPVEILNATPAGRLAFTLPACTLEIGLPARRPASHRHVPNLDTVSIDPDAGRLWMIWRACQVVDKKVMRLEVVAGDLPGIPEAEGDLDMPVEVVVVSCGLMTPVGLSPPEVAASARSRLQRLGAIEVRDRRFERFVVGSVPDEGLPDPDPSAALLPYRVGRMLRLAEVPLQEALAPLPAKAGRIPLMLGLPELQPAMPIDGPDLLARLAGVRRSTPPPVQASPWSAPRPCWPSRRPSRGWPGGGAVLPRRRPGLPGRPLPPGDARPARADPQRGQSRMASPRRRGRGSSC